MTKERTKNVYVVDFAVAAPKEDEMVDKQSTYWPPSAFKENITPTRIAYRPS